jgi:RNase P subunit RPR2
MKAHHTAMPCECPESALIIRSYAGRVLDQMREGYLETSCTFCGRYHRYDLGDCFVLGSRREIQPS